MSSTATVSTSTPVLALLSVWEHWKRTARAVGIVQTRILMVGFYFVLVLPLGLVMRMKGDPLHLNAPKGTNWVPHHDEEVSVESARRQF